MAKEERDLKTARVARMYQDRVDAANDERMALAGIAARRNYTAASRENEFLARFEELTARVMKKRYAPPMKYPKARATKKNRILNMVISDTHYGSLLDGRECPVPFGPIEEARRTAAVFLQAVQYKPQYRDCTTLRAHIIGDLIRGDIHDSRASAPLALQAWAAMDILTQGLSYAARHFSKVEISVTPGNHGRWVQRHPDRAVSQKFDALETVIYAGIKNGLKEHKNVSFNMGNDNKRPYYEWSAFNQTGFATHGDTVLKVGNPNKEIKVDGLRNQINRWNLMLGKKHNLYVVGHVHTGSLVYLPEGSIFMSNGPLIPTDPYGLAEGYLGTSCGQWLFESVEDYIAGDCRFVTVNELTDKEKDLDKIIVPFGDY